MNMYNFLRSLISLIFLNMGVISAANFGGVNIFPKDYNPSDPTTKSRFEVELYPGEEYKNSIVVTNGTGKSGNFVIEAADGLTTKDGAFTLENPGEEKNHIGKWLAVEKKEITLANDESITIPFKVDVPKGTESGDYLGGISVFQTDQKGEQGESSGLQLAIKTRVGVRFYLNVPGELKKDLEITKFTASLNDNDKVGMDFGLTNHGNVRLEPKGEIKIINYFTGATAETFPIDLRLVLPGSPTEVPITWDKSAWLGKYIVKAQVNYGDKVNEISEQEVEIFYVTKKAKIAITISFIFLLLMFVSIVRRSTSSRIKK